MHRLLLLSFIFCTSAFATIVPENNYAIPVGDGKNEGLSEIQYHKVIDKFEITYRSIVEGMGKKFTIDRRWEDPRVNAGATKKGDEWILRLYGGYARHSLVTEDGYILVMCHELGHHLGGFPKKLIGETPDWTTNEGQADYFAALKCMREVFKDDDNTAIILNAKIPAIAEKKCGETFKDDQGRSICIRTVLAAISIANISADLRNRKNPSLDKPDQSVVKKTYDAHPIPQCRLDTYFQGAICEVDKSLPLSLTDEVQGACHTKNGHVNGLRPLCWFKPGP